LNLSRDLGMVDYIIGIKFIKNLLNIKMVMLFISYYIQTRFFYRFNLDKYLEVSSMMYTEN